MTVAFAPKKGLRLVFVVHLAWMGIVFVLGGWWGRLVLKQADRIAELEGVVGLATDASRDQWARTQRMLFWESSTFFVLLIISSLLLIWLYWRDMKMARSLHAFFASVTHELRTPLTSIRLQAESIAESLPEGAGQGRLIERLLEDTSRLESQVERTLELARIEGGGPVYPQPLQIGPWLERALQRWKENYGDRVQFDLQVEDVLIEADPTALQVIVKNLVENAIRHSKKETVLLTIRSEVEASGENVTLTFSDNGSGFNGNVRSLGEIFKRGPESQGAGVGLYLIRTLMNKMGGRVDFRANSGFQVALSFNEGRIHG